tara:strand:- start:1027 stop:2040 length:1014 start_codon:yes stop_codon:yes gene_type:complete
MNKFENFKVNIKSMFLEEIYMNISPASSYRNRCEFGYSNNCYTMYALEKKVYMKHFDIACKAIKDAMPILLNEINNSEEVKEKLFQINFRSNNQNELMVTMIYHKIIKSNLIKKIEEIASRLNIKIIIRSKNFKHASNDFFIKDKLTINNLKLFQSDNSFYQPNKYLLIRMIKKIIDFIDNPDDLIELYCGVGTFTIPLSFVFNNILATENNRVSIKCLELGVKENKIKNIHFSRLSSDEVCKLYMGNHFNRMKGKSLSMFNFSHVLVDPPREGLSDNVLNLIKKFKNIIYVSCNPKTYLRDIKLLSSHRIKNIELFDQFPNTEHLEIVSLLSKEIN